MGTDLQGSSPQAKNLLNWGLPRLPTSRERGARSSNPPAPAEGGSTPGRSPLGREDPFLLCSTAKGSDRPYTFVLKTVFFFFFFLRLGFAVSEFPPLQFIFKDDPSAH